MTFAHPHLLWLLLVPAALFAADRARRRAAEAQSWPGIRRLWAGPAGLAPSQNGARLPRRWSLWLGLGLLVVALARPQWGKIEERVFDQSREVLLALDLSRSMLAADVKPSRLERARLLVESLLDRLKGERVGLLVFSGTAFLQCPLSPDYEVLREFLPALDPDYLPEGGTDYARLLKAALEAFSNEAGADRYLIILSDGEALTDEWRFQLETIKQRGIRVIALGVGTEAGSIIPAKDGGFVKDERGAVVMSKLTANTLKQLASATGGAYAEASGWLDLPALLEQTVERGKQGAMLERKSVRLGERFQWFLAPAFLLLLVSYWREFPVTPKPRDLRRSLGVSSLALLCLLAPSQRLEAAKLASSPTPAPQITQPAPPPASELPKIVEQLAAQPGLSAEDCAKLARETVTHGRNVRQTGQPVPPGIVQDGVAAVDQGERADAKAADWQELRSQLEELLKTPPQQDQQKDEKKNEEEKKQDEQRQQQQEQQQQQDQQKSDDQKQEQSQQEQKQSDQQQQDQPPPQPQHAEPPKENQTQKIGGEKPKDDEAKEHPELAVPLQKLEQVRDQDSPAELFELLHENEPKTPGGPKKDW